MILLVRIIYIMPKLKKQIKIYENLLEVPPDQESYVHFKIRHQESNWSGEYYLYIIDKKKTKLSIKLRKSIGSSNGEIKRQCYIAKVIRSVQDFIIFDLIELVYNTTTKKYVNWVNK